MSDACQKAFQHMTLSMEKKARKTWLRDVLKATQLTAQEA